MLFSRRRQATAVEPGAPDAGAPANGATPDDARDEPPSVELLPFSAAPGSADVRDGPPTNGAGPADTGDETMSMELPPVSPDARDGSAGPPRASGDETGDADLDRFFAALRQVVHDARERLPLADEPTATTMVPTRPDPATTTELSPSTAELIASLEADRDLWRERAVVWRERALGAGMLVNSLNEHVSDLGMNVEDLRMALRVMSAHIEGQPNPPASLPAHTPTRGGLDRSLEPGD